MSQTNPTELRTTTQTADVDLELRVGEGEQGRLLTGYAARYNTLSHDLGGFRERILPGAFKASVGSAADIRSLIDHDSSKLLGRTAAGTLRLSEDAKGLKFEVDLPEGVSYAEDLRILVKRGDVRANSFGFRVPPGGDRFKEEGKTFVRELLNVDLKEVSIVMSLPAYPGTSVQLRVDPGVLDRLPRPNLARATHLMRLVQARG
jgi:HK97 family phage prohead protease